MTNVAPIFGLVLAGGASTRMQQDKALLQYHGRSQIEWAYELIAPFCVATFVSVRADQREDPIRSKFPQIVDRQPGSGPLAGISAALIEHPKAAWLVVACDLPFITESTVRKVLKERDPQRIATAYRSSHDGLPEPLCAIWEPAARERVQAHMDADRNCPRKLLINSDCKLIDLPEPDALDNVNTPHELAAANARLSDGPHAKAADVTDTGPMQSSVSLRVQYFAVLREQAGRSEEVIDSNARDPVELYAELQQRHRFALSPAQLKVAINSEFSDWRARLKHGDTIVFIPPVAGG